MQTNYTFQQQSELDALLIRLYYARNYTPHKVAYYEELVKEFKATNGNLLATFNCKKNPQ